MLSKKGATTVSGILTVLIVMLLLGVSSTGCNSSPNNLRECLIKTMEKDSPEAMVVAKQTCHEMFPARDDGSGVPVGSRFYKSETATCVEVKSELNGVLTKTGFCRDGGRFELLSDGRVSMTCKNLNNKGVTRTFSGQRTNSGVLRLAAPGIKRELIFHPTLAECELSIPENERQAGAALAEEEQRAVEEEKEKAAKQKAAEEKANRIKKARTCCQCLADARIYLGKCMPHDSVTKCETKIVAGNRPNTAHGCVLQQCPEACQWWHNGL